MIIQHQFHLQTKERGLVNITDEIKTFVQEAKLNHGLCHVFLHHTSASLILCENADHLVQRDLEAFMLRLVPDADPIYEHVAEGPDDMPSHVRSVLTQNALTIPITDKKLALGRWQGIYLWEHRLRSHHRHVTVTLHGE